jgi:putative transposase
MARYLRYFVPGGMYFFTVVTHERRPILTTELGRVCLRNALETIRASWPFEITAIVLLPDHLHTIWALPSGDDRYSFRWRRIKEEFTEAFLRGGGTEGIVSASRRKRKERGIWQRRYWEHTLDEECDFERHMDYLHYNPVKHGYVTCPCDWPYSSFHRLVKDGIYPANWGCVEHGPLDFADLKETAME